MNPLRIGMLVVGLVIAAPFVAMTIWGFETNFGYDTVTDKYRESVGRDAVVEDMSDEPEAEMELLAGRLDVHETFTPDEITDERFIIVEQVIDAEALLNTGEVMPSQEFTALYAAARAPARLHPYCADILATIGSTCDLVHTDVRENRDGKLELIGHLAYAPAVALGDPTTVENGDLISTRISLPYEGQWRPANEAQTRQDLITQAQGICDSIREQLGNCVLTQLHLDVSELWITDLEALPAGTNPQRLEAFARFTVFADETRWGQQELYDLVSGLVNPS